MLDLNKLPDDMVLLNWNEELPASGIGDPLGLTLRVGARIGAELLHCITSITPRARYYSFFPWAFQRAHARLGGDAPLREIMQHVLLDERAMTLGAVLHHDGHACEGGALQGSTRAESISQNRKRDPLDLSAWKHLGDNRTGFAAYKGSLINLGIFEIDGAGEVDDDLEEGEADVTLSNGALSERGEQLASAFGGAVARCKYIKLEPEKSQVAFKDLRKFGKRAGLCELKEAVDHDLVPLRELFFATAWGEGNSHYRRRMTLLLLLWAIGVASDAKVMLTARAFDDLTYYRGFVGHDEDRQVPVLAVPPPLDDIVERWRIFHFHKYLTTALETLLAGVVRAISGHVSGLPVSAVLQEFDRPEAMTVLAEALEITIPGSFLELTPESSLALVAAPGTFEWAQSGIERSREHMIERDLRTLIIDEGLVRGPAGGAAGALLLFAILRRYRSSLNEDYSGWNRQKAQGRAGDVSVPGVEHALVTELGPGWWHEANGRVLALILRRFVVQQHEFMSYEKGYGGSPPLFRVDGAAIIGTGEVRDDVDPGNPRFPSAMQILLDLGLATVDETGRVLTDDGREMLDRAIGIAQ